MKKLHEIIEFIDEVFNYKYVWYFLFFVIGIMVGIRLFFYYESSQDYESEKIIELMANHSSLVNIIATVTGTILTITVSLSPALIFQMNKKYNNHQFKKSYLHEYSYQATKKLGVSLIIYSTINLIITFNNTYMQLLADLFLLFVFFLSLVSFTKLISTIESYVSNIDSVLLNKSKNEINKILK